MESEKYNYLHPLVVVLTCFIIFIQTMIIYSAIGNWFQLTSQSFIGLPYMATTTISLILRTTLFAILIVIIGHLTFRLYEQKGCSVIMKTTLIRIGSLIIFFLLVVQPALYLIIRALENNPNSAQTVFEFSWQQINSGPFFFFVIVLIFNFCYCIYKRWLNFENPLFNEIRQQTPQLRSALFVLVVGVISFIIRILIPISNFYSLMHIGYIALFVGMYCSGLISVKNSWITKVKIEFSIPWLIFSLICLVPLVWAVYYSGSLEEVSGGLTSQSLLLSLWEPMACMGGSFFVETLFFKYFNKRNRLAKKLSKLVPSVLVLHPLPIIFFILIFKMITLPISLKWLIVSMLSILTSFFIAATLHRLPILKRIF